MKKTICNSLILIVFLIGSNSVSAQKRVVATGLPGTVWRILKDHGKIDTTGRVMYFYKDYVFEGQNADGSLYNYGRYSIMNNNAFITVHAGAESANQYFYKMNNDTLSYKGYYLSPRFPKEESKIDFESIDEVWVKARDLSSGDLLSHNCGIKFALDSLLSTALVRSAKEGKLIFMDCYTSWCGPCKYLSTLVFTKKPAGDFYNKNFINLSFDMESPEGKLIAAKYKISGYPTLLFLNSKGEIVHKSVGAGGVNYLLTIGQEAVGKKSHP